MGIFSLRRLPDSAKSWLGLEGFGLFHAGRRQDGLGRETWAEQLRLVSSRLKEITVSTEGEFLGIGERLQDFYQRADEITTLLSGLLNRLGGEQSSAAMAGLTEMLDTLEGDQDGMRSEAGQQSLEKILVKLDEVASPLTCFGHMNKSLRMLGVYTKIESARLGDGSAGFESLAKEVTSLSSEVVRKADAILQQKNHLAAVIKNALLSVADMGAEKRARMQAVLGGTRRSLQALAAIVDRCAVSVRTISSSSEEVTGNLGRVVVSLQAHDSVRQQIEHVVAAIDELIERLPSGQGAFQKGRGDEQPRLLVEAGMLCQIQSAQLRHSSTQLMEAVESIIGSLRDIAVRETAMSDDTSDLVGVTDQAGTSFFTEMGANLGEVVTLLSAAAAAHRNLSEVLSGAADTVGNIFRFVDDIEAIAYDIKLIALNFLIQANALGGTGGSLGVLAEEINRLSVEARQQAEHITGVLTEIKAITDSMCQDALSEVDSMEARVRQMRQGVEEMLATLREMHAEMAGGLTHTGAMVQQLSTDIDQVTAGITVHRKVAEVLEEAGSSLGAVTRSAQTLIPADEWACETAKLQAVDSRYTMHSERHVHAAVVSEGALAAEEQQLIEAPQPSADPAPGSDDLGENVELF